MAETQPTRETGLLPGLGARDETLVTIGSVLGTAPFLTESVIGLGLLPRGVPACLFSRGGTAEARDRV